MPDPTRWLGSPAGRAPVVIALLTAAMGASRAACRREPGGKRRASVEPRAAAPARPGGRAPGPWLTPLVSIPAACFERGSGPAAGEAHERPRRRLCLSAFGIERTKVTRAQYARCVAAGRCRAARYGDLAGHGAAGGPVVGVSHGDAQAYCAFVGRRMPTEAEWELAACGPGGRVYPWGADGPTCVRAHFKGCAPEHPLPVAERAPVGPTGTVGMVGNVWEWVADWYAPDAYARAAPTDPKGPATGARRVLRGGSYVDPPTYLRCRARYHWTPEARLTDVGFRCAR